MISGDFYPQAGTFDNGSIIATDFISNLQYADLLEKKMGEPYCIGYVKYEDFPKCIDFHKIIWDSNHIEFKTNPQNIGWGYCLQAGVGSQFPGGRQMYALNTEEQIETWFTGNDERTRFINDVKMATLNTRFGTTYGSGVFPFRLDCVGLILNNEIASDNFVADIQYFTNQTGRFSENFSIDTTFADFENFIKNNGTLTFTMSPFGTYNLKLSDFNEFNIATVQNTDQTFTLYLAIRNLYTSTMSVHGYDGTYYSRMVIPFFCYKFGELATTFLPDISTVYIPGISLNVPYISFRVMQSGSNYAIDPVNLTLSVENRQGCQTGERPFTVTTEDLQNANVQYRTVGIVAGKFLIGNGGGELTNHIHYLYTQNNPAEIYKYLLFYHKAFAGNTIPSASDSWETYYTEWTTSIFDENDSPIGERITGSYTDAAFMAKLRPWQIPDTSITVNEFDADDIPEYTPPGPEPGDDIHDRHTGSTGGLYAGPIAAVSNFVTHWVLDAAQVQEFGAHLWTDLLDFDSEGEPTGTQLWRNAKIALGTYFQTGSFDPGSIMELLIGLRYFPINLANSSYATQQSIPAVYFGTGRVGVNVNTNPWKLDQNAVYITGGDLDLSQLSWNQYDDWRDVYNVSASIYIPFCGTYELPWSDIYNGTLHLSYGIDILSGALTAFVECSLGLNRFLVCVGSGMVGFEVPITATSANRLNAAILGDMGNMMGTLFNPADAVKVATALAGGGGEGSTGGAPVGDIEPTATNAAGSAPIVGQIALAGRVAEIHTGIASRPGITCPAMPGGRGWGALTGQRVPFITIRKGRYAGSAGYSKAEGHPRMETRSIGSMSGYTECINPDLSGIPCSKEEKDMIKQILETGFYA